MSDYFANMSNLEIAKDCVERAGNCQNTVLTTVPVGFLRAILPILEAHYERENNDVAPAD